MSYVILKIDDLDEQAINVIEALGSEIVAEIKSLHDINLFEDKLKEIQWVNTEIDI